MEVSIYDPEDEDDFEYLGIIEVTDSMPGRLITSAIDANGAVITYRKEN